MAAQVSAFQLWQAPNPGNMNCSTRVNSPVALSVMMGRYCRTTILASPGYSWISDVRQARCTRRKVGDDLGTRQRHYGITALKEILCVYAPLCTSSWCVCC